MPKRGVEPRPHPYQGRSLTVVPTWAYAPCKSRTCGSALRGPILSVRGGGVRATGIEPAESGVALQYLTIEETPA